jgi:dihydroorotase-like cyclic amidohydrolase
MRDIKGFGHSHAMHAGVACGSTVTSILMPCNCIPISDRETHMFVQQKLTRPLSTLHVETIAHGHNSFEKNKHCCTSVCVAPHTHACMQAQCDVLHMMQLGNL